jgi:hypothetical protein
MSYVVRCSLSSAFVCLVFAPSLARSWRTRAAILADCLLPSTRHQERNRAANKTLAKDRNALFKRRAGQK